VENKIVEKVQMLVNFRGWLTESESCKEKTESFYTLSAETKTGIQEGATESTDFLFCVPISHLSNNDQLNLIRQFIFLPSVNFAFLEFTCYMAAPLAKTP
jgi:hypothetical protein